MEIADGEAGASVGLKESRETTGVRVWCTLAGRKQVSGVRVDMGNLCVGEGKEG